MEGKWGITLKSHEHPTNPFWPSACWKMEVGEGEIHIMVSISVTVKHNSKTKQKCTHTCTLFYPPKERCYRSLNVHQMGFCLSTMAQYKGSSWKHTERNKLATSNGEQMQWALSDLGQHWKWTCFRWGYLRDSAGITHGSGWRRRQLRLSCPLVTTCFEAGALQEAFPFGNVVALFLEEMVVQLDHLSSSGVLFPWRHLRRLSSMLGQGVLTMKPGFSPLTKI